MVIDINNINPTPPGKPGNGEAESAAKKAVVDSKDSTAKNNTAVDTVELSTAAQDLSRIRETLQNLPDVDHARVDEIRQQIAGNNYQVDADQIADKILSSDQNSLL